MNITRLQSFLRFSVGAALLFILVTYYWTSGDLTSIPLALEKCVKNNPSLDCFNGVKHIQQDDPLLVQLVRDKYLFPPNKGKYNLPPSIRNYHISPSDRVDQVAELLYNFGSGFFIECGALDGILASNTFWLEKYLNWTGLLVEANQKDFASLFALGRKAWTSNLCLSNVQYPNKVNFYVAPPVDEGGLPGVSGLIKRENYNTIPISDVQCVPLYTLLVALNRTTIDYFSLDVEGAELDILKTIPFDKVIFKVMNVENSYIPGGHEALKTFLESKGYVFYRFAPDPINPFDSIFLHSSLNLAQDLLRLKNKNSSLSFKF